MNEQTTLGTRIGQFRKAKKLSGEELGEIIGVGKGTVSQIENGKSNLTVAAIISILHAHPDVDANWLLLGTGEMLRTISKAPVNSGTCWEELEKLQRRFDLLHEDYKQLQLRIKEQEEERH